MPAIILPDKWRRQPKSSVSVNPAWGEGVRWLVSAGSGRQNIITGEQSIPVARDIASTSDGRGFSYSTTADTPSNTRIAYGESSNYVTMFSVFVVDTPNPWSGIIYDRDGWNGICLGDDGLSYRYVWDGSEWEYDTGLTLRTNQIVAAAYAITPTTATFALNGRVNIRTGLSNTSRYWGGAAGWFGSDPSWGRKLQGKILLAGIAVGRAWPASQLLEWTQNPWKIFANTSSKYIYFLPSAGGGASGSFTVQEPSPDTASFTGGVVVQGSFSPQEGGVDSAAFAGLVKVQGSFAVQEPSVDTSLFEGQVVTPGSVTLSAATVLNVTRTTATPRVTVTFS